MNRRLKVKIQRLCILTVALVVIAKVYVDFSQASRRVVQGRSSSSAWKNDPGLHQLLVQPTAKLLVTDSGQYADERQNGTLEKIAGNRKVKLNTEPGPDEDSEAHQLDFLELLSKYGFMSTKNRGVSVVLLWGETGVPGENPPVRPGDHKPSHVPTSGTHYLPHSSNEPEVRLLLSSYMRSGSTFTAGLLATPRVFFVNEPLALMTSWGYLTDDRMWCSQRDTSCHLTLHSNMESLIGTVRQFAKADEYPVDTARRALNNIYSCNFDPGFESLLRRVDKLSVGKSQGSWQEFMSCQGKSPEKEMREACIPVLSRTCQSFTIRMTKVLRLSTDSLAPLLQDDPKLKVVHLFRDPRAIMASRISKSEWYSVGSNSPYSIEENAKSLCTKMLADYNGGLKLLQKFPSRFVMLRYEDLSGPFLKQLSLSLLNFVHLPNTTDISNIAVLNDAFLHYWQSKITVNIFNEINQVCKEAILKIGYNLLHDLPAMKNDNSSVVKH